MTPASAPVRVAAADARRALLAHQLTPGPLAEVVGRLGCVQVDPLAPMGRNHDLVLPTEVLAAPPLDDRAALRRLLRRRVQSAGVLRRAADPSLWSLPVDAEARRATLANLVVDGELEAWEVEGVPYVAWPGLRDAVAEGAGRVEVARVVAPLDNLTWDRRALRELFAFEYLWEVYKPAAARRWGYYVVPLVLGERFVARFDARREASGGAGARLRVHGWWWEDPRPAARETEGLWRGLARFLRYLGADAVALPRGLDRATRALWSAAVAEARS